MVTNNSETPKLLQEHCEIANLIIFKADSVSIDAIADKVGLDRCSVMICLKSLKKAALKMHSLMLLTMAGMLRLQTKKKPGSLTLPVRSRLILDMLLKPVHMLSYDKKQGIQVIAKTSDDLMQDEKHPTISRDYEYKRLSTLTQGETKFAYYLII